MTVWQTIAKITLLVALCALTSCRSDLAVFLNQKIFAGGNPELISLQINDDGYFVLNWTSPEAATSRQQSYRIHITTNTAPPTDMAFNLNQEDSLVSTAILESPTFPEETLVVTVDKATSFIYEKTVDPDLYYSFRVSESQTSNARLSKIPALLAKANFNPVATSQTIVQKDNLKLTWTRVPGATSYEIFDISDDGSSFATTTNTWIPITAEDAVSTKTFCIRAKRGTLFAKECTLVKSLGRNWRPKIKSISTPLSKGVYGEGDILIFELRYFENVTVPSGANLVLPLEINGISRQAIYLDGSGTSTLRFKYTVAVGDNADLIVLPEALAGESRFALFDDALRIADPTLPGSELIDLSKIAVDTLPPTAPRTAGFSSNSSKTLSTFLSWAGGDDANFSHYNAKLCLDSGCSSGCLDERIVLVPPVTLTGTNGESFYGCVQSQDSVGHTSPWTASLIPVNMDNVRPAVSQISSLNPDGIFTNGAVISLAVDFTENVIVHDAAGLKLNLSTGGQASYHSGSGSNRLVLQYIVRSTDVTSDLDIASSSALTVLAESGVTDIAGNGANLSLPVPGSLNSIAGVAQLVIDNAAPANPNTVLLASTLTTNPIVSVSWNNSTDAHFKTHQLKLCTDDDCQTDCETPISHLASPANLTGTTGNTYFACVRGEDLGGLFSSWIASTNSVRIDGIAPSILDVTSSKPNGAYTTGAIIDINVRFSEPVTATSTSEITLNIPTGGTDAIAYYQSGSSTDTLVFRYTVNPGDSNPDLDYSSVNALVVTGAGTIQDGAGNDALPTLPAPGSPASLAGSKNLIVDTTDPTQPAIVGFATASTNSLSFPVSWSGGSDTNLLGYNAKICENIDCVTSCLPPISAASSPATLTGETDKSYYACVQSEDLAGLKSGWQPSPGLISIDDTDPVVVSIGSTQTQGAYKAGVNIGVTVTFQLKKPPHADGDFSQKLLGPWSRLFHKYGNFGAGR